MKAIIRPPIVMKAIITHAAGLHDEPYIYILPADQDPKTITLDKMLAVAIVRYPESKWSRYTPYLRENYEVIEREF